MLLAIFIGLSRYTSAQDFFIQANFGAYIAKLHQTTFKGTVDAHQPATSCFQLGISGLDAEGGFNFTTQRINEDADGFLYRRTPQGNYTSTPVKLRLNYGDRLLTYEAFANGKIRIGQCRVLCGLVGGIVKTTGEKGRYFEEEYAGTYYRNYGQGKGWLWGGHLAFYTPLIRGFGLTASTTYKNVRFKIKQDIMNYKSDEDYHFSLIPITIGLRCTFR